MPMGSPVVFELIVNPGPLVTLTMWIVLIAMYVWNSDQGRRLDELKNENDMLKVSNEHYKKEMYWKEFDNHG